MDYLICNSCVKEGQKSCCRASRTFNSKNERDRYWDEEGELHDHGSSVTLRLVKCSQDHLFYWTHSAKRGCKKCDIERKTYDMYQPTNREDLRNKLRNCDIFVVEKDLKISIR